MFDNKGWEPHFCQRGVEGCYCAVGYPYEKMCPDCRDGRAPDDIYSYCVCPERTSGTHRKGLSYHYRVIYDLLAQLREEADKWAKEKKDE